MKTNNEHKCEYCNGTGKIEQWLAVDDSIEVMCVCEVDAMADDYEEEE